MSMDWLLCIQTDRSRLESMQIICQDLGGNPEEIQFEQVQGVTDYHYKDTSGLVICAFGSDSTTSFEDHVRARLQIDVTVELQFLINDFGQRPRMMRAVIAMIRDLPDDLAFIVNCSRLLIYRRNGQLLVSTDVSFCGWEAASAAAIPVPYEVQDLRSFYG